MSRYERAQFFEALLELREAYAVRSDFDRRSVISIEDAIAYSEAVMAALDIEAEDALVLDELETLRILAQRTTAMGDPRD
jgi:hypothetical protein